MSPAAWGVWLVAALFTAFWSLALVWYWALEGMSERVGFAWAVTMVMLMVVVVGIAVLAGDEDEAEKSDEPDWLGEDMFG